MNRCPDCRKHGDFVTELWDRSDALTSTLLIAKLALMNADLADDARRVVLAVIDRVLGEDAK